MGERRTIFISWAGDRSYAVATALKFWLPCFSADLAPWMSSDLTPGRRWNPQLAARLDATDAGIVCVTADNQDSRWLNFEAGALSRSIERAHVIPFVVGAHASSIGDPISQFQCVEATRVGALKLVKTLLGTGAAAAMDPKLFEAFWPPLERVIALSDKDAGLDAASGEIEMLSIARQSLALKEVTPSSTRLRRGETLQIQYGVETQAHGLEVWLGAAMWIEGLDPIYNLRQDRVIRIRRGFQYYKRELTIPPDARPGEYRLNAEIRYGPKSDPDTSYPLQGMWPTGHVFRVE